MQATANSRHSSIVNPAISPARRPVLKATPWEPKRVNKRCPATMLAASRMANVPGRIIFLTVSIITITGIKVPGVPAGTRWANILLYWFFIDHTILPSQIGRAKDSVNTMCLVPVNTNGNSPIKLEKRIKKSYKNKDGAPHPRLPKYRWQLRF